MAIRINYEEVSQLVYNFLVETGFKHSAFIFKHEAGLNEYAHIAKGALVQYLEKALYLMHVQQHASMEEGKLTLKKCYAPLSLLTPHVCGSGESLPNLTRLISQKSNEMEFETELKGHTNDVSLLQWMETEETLVTRSEDSIRVWDLKGANSVPTIVQTAPGKTLKLFQVSSEFKSALYYNDGTFEISSGAEPQASVTSPDLTLLKWNPAGSMIATLRDDNTLTTWTADLLKVQEQAVMTEELKSLEWKSNEEFTTASIDGVITLWVAHEAGAAKTSSGHRGWKETLWNKSGTLFACMLTEKFEVLDDQLEVIMSEEEQCTAMDWVPTESKLLTGSTEGEIKVWDLESLSLAFSLKNSREMITRIICHPSEDAFALVSSNWDGNSDWRVQICDTKSRSQTKRYSVPCSVNAISWNASGTLLAYSYGCTVRVHSFKAEG